MPLHPNKNIRTQRMEMLDEIEAHLLDPTIYRTRLRLMSLIDTKKWGENFFAEHGSGFYSLLMELREMGKIDMMLGKYISSERQETADADPILWEDISIFYGQDPTEKRLIFDERLIAIGMLNGQSFRNVLRIVIRSRHQAVHLLQDTRPMDSTVFYRRVDSPRHDVKNPLPSIPTHTR